MKKVRIQVLGDEFEVPAGDSLLRALQLYGIERGLPPHGFSRFCWNSSCKQCFLEWSCGGRRDRDYACQTEVRDGLAVESLPKVLAWGKKIRAGG